MLPRRLSHFSLLLKSAAVVLSGIKVQTVQISRQVNGFQYKQYDSKEGKALLNTLHYRKSDGGVYCYVPGSSE